MTSVAILRMKEKKEESLSFAEGLGLTARYASPLELAEEDSPIFWRFAEELEAGKVKMVVITSPTAVRYMLNLLNKKEKAGLIVRKLNEKGIIGIGPSTAEAAKQQWIKVEAVPEKFTSESIADRLKGKLAQGDKVWIVRSDKPTDVLSKGLESLGAIVEEVGVYSLQKTEPDRSLLDIYYWAMRGGIDAIAFTSSRTAEVFIEEGERKYGVREFGKALNEMVIAAINDATKRTLDDLGISVDVVPKDGSFEGMMRGIRTYYQNDQ
jgi:uroporphyrinogen-III synthase